MTQEQTDKRIADEIRDAVTQLNSALAKASEAGLDVELDYLRHHEFGMPGPQTVYSVRHVRRLQYFA